nr:xanthine dehydrogenase molybdopterin binding subunit [Polynucleobacter kasalickyi]
MLMNKEAKTVSTMGKQIEHESAHLHVSGNAQYIDDMALPVNALHVALGVSSVARGKILELDLCKVKEYPGVVTVLTSADIPGENNFGCAVKDDPIFPESQIDFYGQPLFAVVASSHLIAKQAAKLARVQVEEEIPIFDIREAIEKSNFVLPPVAMEKGNVEEGFASATHRLKNSIKLGGQEHFYLEGNIAYAIPMEDGELTIYSSSQHPSEVQHLVSHALNLPAAMIRVECKRLGGGFGGKESQPAWFAIIAALAAKKTKFPVKLRIDREMDMTITGKRHDFEMDYEVGFDATGKILSFDVMMASRCGFSADLSGPVNDRALFHLDNCYFIPNLRAISYRCKTNTVSNTAFRGFGGPQGMYCIEYAIEDIADFLKVDPLEIRKKNFYQKNMLTHFDMPVEDIIIDDLVSQLVASSQYVERRQKIEKFNQHNKHFKRGISLTPVKFGISFTATHFNQAGALIHIYTDGSILVNHGGLEMGQGLNTKIRQIVANEFQVDFSVVKMSATDTSKIPNTSATAASSGTDLNGMASQNAAQILITRMKEFLANKYQLSVSDIVLKNNQVHLGDQTISFEKAVQECYVGRISLSATGFYATPKIHYDSKTRKGRPFFYFSYGAAVSEVVVDTLTGEMKLLQVDILHDVGQSINPAIDKGQIEGGFLQGLGWLTSEELWWNPKGKLMTNSPSTYKIPTAFDWPKEGKINLYASSGNIENTIYKSKAVGEPPLMLAFSAFHAIKHAIRGQVGQEGILHLVAPATPESILNALNTPFGLV